jgi:hypothetical protein
LVWRQTFKIFVLKNPKLGVLKCEELIGLERDWRFYQIFLKKSLNPNQGSFNESEEKDWRFS